MTTDTISTFQDLGLVVTNRKKDTINELANLGFVEKDRSNEWNYSFIEVDFEAHTYHGVVAAYNKPLARSYATPKGTLYTLEKNS